MMRSRANY